MRLKKMEHDSVLGKGWKMFKKICLMLGIGIGVVAIISLFFWFPDSAETVITGTNSRDINGVDTYLVFTDYATMTNHDCKMLLKWKSDDVQATARRLKGKKVKIKKYGYDIPFFSIRENILSIKEVKPEEVELKKEEKPIADSKQEEKKEVKK